MAPADTRHTSLKFSYVEVRTCPDKSPDVRVNVKYSIVDQLVYWTSAMTSHFGLTWLKNDTFVVDGTSMFDEMLPS